MATVNKNFRIKQGLVVEGTTGTINGQNILTETGGDQYILNLVGGATLVKSVSGNLSVDQAGQLSLDQTGLATDLAGNRLYTSGDTLNVDVEGIYDDLISNGVATTTDVNNAISTAASDATNKANAALADAQNYANNLASNYDSAGSAAAAELAAKNYADGLAGNYDAAGAATSAENAAKFYADGLIADLGGSGTASVAGNIDILTGTGIQVNGGNNSVEIDRQTVDTWYDSAGSASAAQQAAQLYADNAVADLVGSAPAVLDTIQELATALENNPDIIADLENVAAGKQDTLTAGSNIDITGSTISVTGLNTDDVSEGSSRLYFTNTRAQDAIGAGTGLTKDGQGTELAINRQVVDTWYDAAGAAASAQSAAEDYAESLSANYDQSGAALDAQTNAENFASGLVGNLIDATTPFDAVNINDVAKQVAARSTSLGSVTVTAYQFNKSAFKSGKFLVKIDNGTNNEISEILVTLDSSNNVAITEYAIVGTNGSRGTITADVDSTHCRIRVTPVNDSTITVSGTIFNA